MQGFCSFMNSEISLTLFVFKQLIHYQVPKHIRNARYGSFHITDVVDVFHVEINLEVVPRDFHEDLVNLFVLDGKSDSIGSIFEFNCWFVNLW